MFLSFLASLDEFAGASVFPLKYEEQHIFLRKRSYPKEGWTDWMPPDQVSGDRDVQFKILYGRTLGNGIDVPRTVMARFKVGSYVDWRTETDGLTPKSDLSSCPLGHPVK